MKRWRKSLLGLALCVAMVIGLAAEQAPAAKADEGNSISGLGTAGIANPTGGNAADYAGAPRAVHSHDDVTFTEWTSTNSLPTDAGNYYLAGNVTTSGGTRIDDSLNLCLDGHTITNVGNSYLLNVSYGNMTIFDGSDGWGVIKGTTSGTQYSTAFVSGRATLTLKGGTFTGATKTERSG